MKDNLQSDSLCHKIKLGGLLPSIISCSQLCFLYFLPDPTAEDEAVSYLYSSNCTNAEAF